jgi:hypothetical protein
MLGPSRRGLLVATVLSACAVATAGCGGSSSSAGVNAHTGDDELQSIFGASTQLLVAPAATLDTLRSLGVERVRVDIRWSQLAPAPTSPHAPLFNAADPTAYPSAGWAPYDAAFQAAAAHGIGIDATIGGTAPLWAEGSGDPLQKGEPLGIWKPRPALFEQFVKAVGTRYDGRYTPPGATHPLPRISFWSFWNEPNYGQDLAPQASHHSTVELSPSLYRGLLDAGYAALQATGHARDTILFGETAPRGQTVGNVPGNFGLMKPLRFLRALYCVDASYRRLSGIAASERGCPATPAAAERFVGENPALFGASGLAAHLYPQGAQPPNLRLPDEPDDADFASLPELDTTLDRSSAAWGKARRLPIYSTEFGYHTDPPEAYQPSPALAAAYMNEAEYLSWRNPRIRSYDQYLLADPSGASLFATGLEFADGRPKATFAAFRMPLYLPRTSETSPGSLEVWGCVRPAHTAPGPQRVAIQFAPRGRPFRTLKMIRLPDPAGYFDTTASFRRTGTVRLAWSPPGGPELFSRAVTVTVS